MRRAKIVATLGPATSSLEAIRGLVDAGMDVARLNLSHGDHAVHLQVYNNVRAAADAAGRGVGILVDLQGPKIRLGRFADGPVLLQNGAEFIVTTEDVPGDVHMGLIVRGLVDAGVAPEQPPEVIIPRSDTVIEQGDHVVFFLPHKRLVGDVEKLFRVSATFF